MSSSTSSKPSVLIIGLPWDHPAVKAMDPDPLVIKNMLEQTVKDMRAAGYEDFTPVWTGPEQGLGELEDRLKEKHWDGIIIGAHVRMSPNLMPFMEDIIRTVRELSPKTQIVFNTSLKDNEAAAERIRR